MYGGGKIASENYSVPNVAVVNDELRVRSESGSASFDVQYTPVAPAVFTGKVREALTEGSLDFFVEMDVTKGGRYLLSGRVDEEKGVSYFKEGTGENNMDEEWDQMHRITACKAEEDYKLWLRFEDGLEGSVFLGNLLEIGAFQLWRDVREFEKVSVDPDTATVTWEGGIRLDSDVLYQDLASRSHPIQHAGGGNPPPAVG